MTSALTLALPKGRIAEPLGDFLARPPLSLGAFEGRRLVAEVPEKGLRLLLLNIVYDRKRRYFSVLTQISGEVACCRHRNRLCAAD